MSWSKFYFLAISIFLSYETFGIEDKIQINISSESLNDSIISFSFLNHNISFRRDVSKINNSKTYWSGVDCYNSQNYIRISNLDNTLYGYMVYEGLEFDLRTNDNSVHLIEKQIPEETILECGSNNNNRSEFNINDNDLKVNFDDLDFSKLATLLPYDCKIRIMVFYSQEASNTIGGSANARQHAHVSMNDFNQILINSQIDLEAELVYVATTNYSEGSRTATQMLNHMILNNNNYWTDIRDLIENYSADVTILMTNNVVEICQTNPIDYCNYNGRAIIKACNNSSMAVVKHERSYQLNYHTFSHEIGHIFGLIHDDDNNSAPLVISNGKGFLGENQGNDHFRTLMGVQPKNPPPYHARVAYFSTPQNIYQINIGNTTYTSAGTAWQNSRSGIIDYKSNMMSHRPFSGKRIVRANDVVTWSLYGDLYHPLKIETSTQESPTAFFTPYNKLKMVAGEEVYIIEGFWFDATVTNNTFEAGIINSVCGTANNENCRNNAFRLSINNFEEKELTYDSKVSVYPTFVGNSLLNITNPKNECLTVSIFNLKGVQLANEFHCDPHFTLRLPPIARGEYLVVIEGNNFKSTSEIFIE